MTHPKCSSGPFPWVLITQHFRRKGERERDRERWEGKDWERERRKRRKSEKTPCEGMRMVLRSTEKADRSILSALRTIKP